MKTLIYNATVINEGREFAGAVAIDSEYISSVAEKGSPEYEELLAGADRFSKTIDATGALLIPGVIDDQVHFREPGATHKGDIRSESAAAVLGGTTSFMDMPNNNPPAVTLERLEEKYRIASEVSSANYSFYLGATNENIDEIRKADSSRICGIKLFMGSSTGNMLVNSDQALDKIFSSGMLVATHCEDEQSIRDALEEAKTRWGYDSQGKSLIPFREHPVIRSAQSCIKCTSRAIELALKHHSRLHILHISTARELDMIRRAKEQNPGITSEICVHYLYFDDSDYDRMGAMVKCNPAIKSRKDREAIIHEVASLGVDAVATDHAPHTLPEKEKDYLNAPSGLPTIQHSLQMMLELSEKGLFPRTTVVTSMCHKPADCFRVSKRGYIRPGYYADLVLVRRVPYTVSDENIAYKCGWSPLKGTTFTYSVTDTFVNGCHTVADGKLTGETNASRLSFDRL